MYIMYVFYIMNFTLLHVGMLYISICNITPSVVLLFGTPGTTRGPTWHGALTG